MKVPIREAQRVAENSKARQVVIIAIDGNGAFQVTSYGATKAECSAVKPMCNTIADALKSGKLGLNGEWVK